MDDEADFNSVTWERDTTGSKVDNAVPSPELKGSTLPTRSASDKRRRSDSDEPQAGPNADGVDLAGVGDGVLECTVDTPLKENDGTNDAYVSYLVTTHVSQDHSCPKTALTEHSLLAD